MNPDTQSLQLQLNKLQKDFQALSDEFYRNNFSARKDETKYIDIKTMLKVPSYSTLPSTCQVGELVESAGKLRICSAANTWTIVGTQS